MKKRREMEREKKKGNEVYEWKDKKKGKKNIRNIRRRGKSDEGRHGKGANGRGRELLW